MAWVTAVRIGWYWKLDLGAEMHDRRDQQKNCSDSLSAGLPHCDDVPQGTHLQIWQPDDQFEHGKTRAASRRLCSILAWKEFGWF